MGGGGGEAKQLEGKGTGGQWGAPGGTGIRVIPRLLTNDFPVKSDIACRSVFCFVLLQMGKPEAKSLNNVCSRNLVRAEYLKNVNEIESKNLIYSSG